MPSASAPAGIRPITFNVLRSNATASPFLAVVRKAEAIARRYSGAMGAARYPLNLSDNHSYLRIEAREPITCAT